MSLRPLHFRRVERATSTVPARSVPGYGRGSYLTECGRFDVRRAGGGRWGLRPRLQGWRSWFSEVGLNRASFATRREAVEVLESVLAGDGLLDARVPS